MKGLLTSPLVAPRSPTQQPGTHPQKHRPSLPPILLSVSTAVTPYPSSHLCQNLGSSLESSSRFPPPLPSDCLNCWTVLYDQAWTLLAPVCFTASATQELPHLPGGESSSQLLLLPATISSVYIEAIGPLLPYDPDRCLTPHLKSKLLNMFFQALPQA